MTDIEGSTRLWEEYPESMSTALRRHDELMRTAIEGAGGYVFKEVGDSFCAAFATASDAVRAAATAQEALGGEVWPEPIDLRVRIALHTGSCEERGGDFFGPAVNRVARLEAVAHGGQVLVSGVTAHLLSDTIPRHTSLRDLGAHRLKDLSQPEHVFQLDIAGRDTEFPALRSLDNPKLDNNLPIQLTSFVGRDHELSDVSTLVDESPLVTLTGAGGAGKTRLALAVAADLLDGSGDGVWFVDLASLADPELVASATAGAIGVRDEPGRPVLETLLDALRSRRLLLLLDNCEHLIDGCVKLVDALLRSCPRVHVLATSREPLGLGGERTYRVPPLTLPGDDPLAAESVQLFIERAHEHRPDFVLAEKSVAVLGALCRRLDGMPLAIELAAARVRSLSLEDIESRLDQRFRLLTGGNRGTLERHQTLRALIDWSYDLLDEREQKTLDYLSVFAGGFDLTATEAMCAFADVQAWEVVDVIGSLVDRSLVLADQTNTGLRYRLLETIRQYADERLAERGEGARVEARATHAWAYLTLAESAVPHLAGDRQLEWIDRLDTEQDNIITAIDHFVADPDAGQEALRLVVAASELWNVRSRPDSAQAIAAALSHPGAQTPSALRAAALGELASHLEGREGRKYLEEGLAIARSVDNPAVLAKLLVDLSFLAFLEGDERTCNEAADEAVRVAESIRSDRLLAWALQRKAGAFEKRDLDQSTALCRRALGLVRNIGDRRSEESALTNVALCEAMKGNLDLARESWNDALAIANELGNELGQSVILNCLGDLTLEEGDPQRAYVDLCRSLRIARRTGSRRFQAYGLLSLAATATALGLVRQSATLHGAADVLFEDLGHPPEAPAARTQRRSLRKLHEAMGEAFDSAYATGRQLELDAAIELALHLRSNAEL
jgi:predicted ATPase/class 3 adenylate cyclase